MLVPGVATAVSQAVQAVASELDMSIEDIKAIADVDVATAGVYGEGAREKLKGGEVASGAFSEFPAAQSFGEQHAAARQVFLTTLAGVSGDLERFKQNLSKSAEDAEQQDQNAQQMLISLGKRSESQTYEATHNFDVARDENSEHLEYKGNDDGGRPTVARPETSTPTQAASDGHPTGPGGEQYAR